MKNSFIRQKTVLINLFVLIGATALSSCEKMNGHSIVPVTSSTGSGTATGSSGTVTFTINNGATYTWTQPGYFTSLGTTPTTGSAASASNPSTIVTFGPLDASLFLTTGFSISFPGITPGTYPMDGSASGVRLPNLTLTAAGGTEKVTVTQESVTILSTSTGMAKGAVSGTFDGMMLNNTNNESVRVSGSFSIQQN